MPRPAAWLLVILVAAGAYAAGVALWMLRSSHSPAPAAPLPMRPGSPPVGSTLPVTVGGQSTELRVAGRAGDSRADQQHLALRRTDQQVAAQVEPAHGDMEVAPRAVPNGATHLDE